MPKYKNYVLFLATFVGVFVCLYGFYLLISAGLPDKAVYLQLRRYLPCALAVAIALALWRRAQLPLRKLVPYLLVGLLWVLVYPLCYWLTFHLNTTFIDNHFDIAFGAYVFTALVCLRLLLLQNCHNTAQQASDAFLLSLLQLLLISVPVAQIIYYLSYKTPVTEAGWMALLQTNPAEAREFVLQNFGVLGLLSAGVFVLILLILFFRANKLPVPPQKFSAKLVLALLVILLGTGFYCQRSFQETGAMWAYQQAHEYFVKSSQFTANHAQNFAALQVTPTAPKFSKPGTIIMVIGESATRYYMSAYGYKENDTTPWMRAMSSQPDFILFKHAYSSWGQTVPSLERALTEKNQYNDLEFNNSVTILDLAKKAGYTTYWFSNQGSIGNADTPITLVAKTADHSAWIEDSLANTDSKKYDGDLLKYLPKVDPQHNNFIILHIMGSHDNYINRYPPEFTRWGKPNVYDPIPDYDNSLAYTDQFLQDLYTYAHDHLNLQALLYFSDHGVDPRFKRHPDNAGFISLRIPLFLYLSPEYRSLYPQTAAALRAHQDSYFTNDLLYETMAGIFNITSNHYDETNSLASPKYKYTRDLLRTNLGKTKLTDDKEE
jgi:heptose-I-phosphate ethanolaminephosphotransferase